MDDGSAVSVLVDAAQEGGVVHLALTHRHRADRLGELLPTVNEPGLVGRSRSSLVVRGDAEDGPRRYPPRGCYEILASQPWRLSIEAGAYRVEACRLEEPFH